MMTSMGTYCGVIVIQQTYTTRTYCSIILCRIQLVRFGKSMEPSLRNSPIFSHVVAIDLMFAILKKGGGASTRNYLNLSIEYWVFSAFPVIATVIVNNFPFLIYIDGDYYDFPHL